MAKIIDIHMPIVMGNCIHVLNIEKEVDSKLSKEPNVFICIQVENEDGKVEYPILMTQDEYDKLERAVFPNMKDMIAGRIYVMFIRDNNYYCVKLKDVNGDVFVGVFDIGDWAEYYKRATHHPKSVTKKSIITDILD